jgi:hypothetical protein
MQRVSEMLKVAWLYSLLIHHPIDSEAGDPGSGNESSTHRDYLD